MARRFIKYNPSFLSQEDLIRNFVVRRSDLELIIRIIRDNVTDSNQHLLIIGPRGSGKTTLALRVAAEVENDTELQARWYPLTFSEESYEVVSAAEFWLEALFHLAEQTGDEKRKRTHADLKNETDEQRLGERALAQLLDFADSQGKRILLIVENLNMLFSDLISEDEAWKMRHTLLNEPRLMLLATATSRFEGIDNSSQAMYEMFKLHELKRLDTTECNNIWEMITGSKLIGEQIRPIEILTGGNPRLLTIIAGFSAHRSFGKLLEDLVDLIDDHTEYFKSHLDNLPPIERKAYLALAEMWDPSTARDIAQSARLDVSKTSSLLNRLVGRGAVIVERQEKKTKWYMVAERMYNIYYLMRRRGKPADRVKAAVKFMISMYDPETASSLITEEACKLSPELCQDHYLAYEITLNQVRDHHLVERIIAATPKSFLDSPYMNEVFKNLSGVRNIETELSLDSEESPALLRARKFVEDGRSLFREGRYDQAIEKLDQAIEELSHSDTLLQLAEAARAMVNKGVSLGALNRSAEAIQVYDELVALHKEHPEPQIVEMVATAMVNKGFRLGALNRSAEEIQVYDELVALYKERPEPQIVEQVARAMINKGMSLGALNRSAEEIQVYDELVALYRERPEPQIAEKVAMAMVSKGYRLGALNRSTEEIQVYDELVALYKERPEPQIVEKVAMAMVNKGYSFDALNRSAEEIQVYDELVALYKERPEPQIVEKVATAMLSKGFSLDALNRSAEAIPVYDELIALYKERPEPQIVEQVAMAMVSKGFSLDALNRSAEAIPVYDELVALYKERPEPQIVEKVAMAMVSKGFSLDGLNRSAEEIPVYDELIALYKERPEPQIVEQVASAMINKGMSLGALNRSAEEIQVYDELVALYRERPEPQIAEKVAMAMVNKGIRLGALNRSAEAIQVYDELVALYKERPEPQIAEKVARTLVNKGKILIGLDRPAEAEAVFIEAIEINPAYTKTHIQLINLLLNIPGREDEALMKASEVISANPENASLLNSVAWNFYEHGSLSGLEKAQEWAQSAVLIKPEASAYQHTLACILAACGSKEALVPAKKYIQDDSFVEQSIDDAIQLFVVLAAAGYAKEALGILVNSPAAKHLEPLVAGLRLFIGEKLTTAVEILEVAKDVVKRIEERMRRRF